MGSAYRAVGAAGNQQPWRGGSTSSSKAHSAISRSGVFETAALAVAVTLPAQRAENVARARGGRCWQRRRFSGGSGRRRRRRRSRAGVASAPAAACQCNPLRLVRISPCAGNRGAAPKSGSLGRLAPWLVCVINTHPSTITTACRSMQAAGHAGSLRLAGAIAVWPPATLQPSYGPHGGHCQFINRS